MTATAIDIIVLAVVLLSALIAFFRGFIKEVLTIAGLIGAVIVAWGLGPFTEPWFTDVMTGGDPENAQDIFGFIPPEVMAQILNYGSIFLVTFFILALITYFTSEAAQEMGLGAIDRSLGVLFGIFRGFLLVFIVYLPFAMLIEKDEFPEWTEESRSIQVMHVGAEWVEANFEEIEDIQKGLEEDAKDAVESVGKAGEAATGNLGSVRGLIDPEGGKNAGRKQDKAPRDGDTGYDAQDREGLKSLFEEDPDSFDNYNQ